MSLRETEEEKARRTERALRGMNDVAAALREEVRRLRAELSAARDAMNAMGDAATGVGATDAIQWTGRNWDAVAAWLGPDRGYQMGQVYADFGNIAQRGEGTIEIGAWLLRTRDGIHVLPPGSLATLPTPESAEPIVALLRKAAGVTGNADVYEALRLLQDVDFSGAVLSGTRTLSAEAPESADAKLCVGCINDPGLDMFTDPDCPKHGRPRRV